MNYLLYTFHLVAKSVCACFLCTKKHSTNSFLIVNSLYLLIPGLVLNNMEEFQVLYTKVILRRDVEMDLNNMREREVRLEIDAAYKIGKSVAVILEDQIVGHLTRWVAKPAWLHLRHGNKLNGTIYGKLISAKIQCNYDSIKYRYSLIYF